MNCDSDFSGPSKEIRAGKVVVFPTDTVYGLGTNPASVVGIRNCFEIKKRDVTKKMPVLFNDFNTAASFAIFGKNAEHLAEIFWPGKLTIVLSVRDSRLPQELIGDDKTVAIRVPDHECCLRLISACGGSLIGTSANISGEQPMIDPSDPRLLAIADSVDFFVAGACGENSGVSSTVIDATNDKSIKIIRVGAISSEVIFSYLEKFSSTDIS